MTSMNYPPWHQRAVGCLNAPDDPLAGKEWITAKIWPDFPLLWPDVPGLQNELANWFGDYFKDLNILFKSNFSTNGAIMVQNGLGYSLWWKAQRRFWDKDKSAAALYIRNHFNLCAGVERQQPFSRAPI